MYLEPCTKADIPEQLLQRFEHEKEEAERKRREKEELRWVTSLGLVVDADIIGHNSNDLTGEPKLSIKVCREGKLDY